MFLRGVLCALLISAMGSFALAIEKPSAGKAKVSQQPKKPTLRLLSPRFAVANQGGPGGPDLVIELRDFKYYGSLTTPWHLKIWFDVKNRGSRIAGTSRVRVEGTHCEDKIEKVPQLPAGTWWTLNLHTADGKCKWIVTADALNQVAESNEGNNVYAIE